MAGLEEITQPSKAAKVSASEDISSSSSHNKLLGTAISNASCTVANQPIMSRDSSRVVILAVDGGDQSKAAFHFFMRRFRQSDDRLIFVHVQSPPAGVWKDPNAVWKSMIDSARKLETEVMENWCSGDNEVKDKRWISEFCSGAGAAIVKVAADNAADLIVMGSRGLGTIRRTIMGSVSSFVMHHTEVPLIVVPPAKH